MTEVLVAGLSTVDFVMRVETLPTRADKYRARDASVVLGGCGANAALAIARQGGRARLVSRLGGDAIGALIVERLDAAGIDTSLVHRSPGGMSSFSSVQVDSAGERQIVNFRGAGLAERPDWFDDPGAPQAVLTDTRWPALAQKVLGMARARGIPGVIDAEAPIDPAALAGATHIAFSAQGLEDYAGGTVTEAALRRAAAEFGCWVAVTEGANGVRFLEDGTIGHVPAFPVHAVDTLGAGDVWHGVLALCLAEGADTRRAIRRANAAAALKCTGFGGASACPDRAATDALLKEI
ncbi:PfkB family carbohydrate kinase [Tropicimonas sp.]|uniref:PfkB family carbohydrate kinase n=1 Tax=Tropicimonas sp. TaxID=2067044 RepID=UPI003A8AEF3F